MRKLLALLLFAPGCIDAALADQPHSLGNPMQYARVASPVWGHEHTAPTAADITGFVAKTPTAASDENDVYLFEWGSLVVVSCQSAATFCFVMDTNETTMSVAGVVTDTDAGGDTDADGPGSCFRVEAGLYRDVTVWRDNFRARDRVGRRQGYCSGDTDVLDYPCDADADCGSGTCNLTVSSSTGTSSPFDKIRGAFLLSRAGSAATCFVSEEK